MRTTKIHWTFFMLLIWCCCPAQTRQTAGGYTLKHYGVKSFGMHPRNFCIVQDRQELLYFGNAYGILQYDAESWRSINLPNGNSGLALLSSSQGTLYAAGFNELGKLSPSSNGLLRFESLQAKIPDSLHFNRDFLSIEETGQTIIFHCELGLHLYENNAFKTLRPAAGNLFTYLKKTGGTVYVLEKGKGLLTFSAGALLPVHNGSLLKDKTIKEIVALDNGSLLIAETNGLFLFNKTSYLPYPGICNKVLAAQQITHLLRLPEQRLLVTTYNNGFYLFDAHGQLIKHISVANGLPDNTINQAFLDRRGGLWLALDNGIAYLEINTPFSFAGPDAGLAGMGYAATLYQDKLYLGTSQGVYYCAAGKDLTQEKFLPVQGIRGQVWDLAVVDHTLFCCQSDRLFRIEGGTAFPVAGPHDDEGHWKIVPLLHHPGYALKGTYLGFQLYRFHKGRWVFEKKLPGFEESCRIFEQDQDGTVWMCHGNKGIYRIRIDKDLTRMASAENISLQNGFAPDYFNDVAYINGELVFAADDGVFRFDRDSNKPVKDTALERIIGADRFISRIRQYSDGNIWLFNWEDVNLYRKKKNGAFQPVKNVFRKIAGELVGSYEFVKPLTAELAIIGSQEGFTFFHMQEDPEQEKQYGVLIRKAEAHLEKDTLLFGGDATPSLVRLPYDFQALRISFASPFHENHERLMYQYALTSHAQPQVQWTGWNPNTQVDFSNLPEGSYVFHVRAKNIYEQLSEEETLSFTILPPWYRSWWAYSIQGIVLALVLFLSWRYIVYRFRKQKEKLELQKQNELQLLEQQHLAENLQREKELVELRNARLESDMVLKNSELASLATTVTQKTEFLAHLKDKLENIQKESDKHNSVVFKQVIKTIDQDLDFDDDWTKFQVHFDEMHHHFLHRLREKYPKLNPSWLLLCAYIRMNKSNKEIAALMNISLSAVEKRKYRLREKLELTEDDRLADFIISF